MIIVIRIQGPVITGALNRLRAADCNRLEVAEEGRGGKLTVPTRNLAASSMLMLSLADVSNQPAKPFSLQYSSNFPGVATMPSLGWSHCLNEKKSQTLTNKKKK